MQHGMITRSGKVWTCRYCKASGTYKEMHENLCSAFHGKGMTPNEQLVAWVRGESKCPNDNNECCPDFSCCTPSIATPKAKRIAFLEANDEEREKMLMGFLGRLTSGMGVHIAGQDIP